MFWIPKEKQADPAGINLFKVNNGNARLMCYNGLKLITKTLEHHVTQKFQASQTT